ncbi:MAG: potassium channel family protein [Acidobacteriota bacterium]
MRIAILMAAILLLGTSGFMIVEGWGVVDSLYMAVITLTTVGFGEVHHLDTPGRLFVIGYLVAGLGVFLYGAAQIGEVFLRGQLMELFGGRRMNTMLKSIEGHVIVCGLGRMGWKLSQQLAKTGQSFVIVDRDKEALADAAAEGWHTFLGDATDDRVLEAVRVERARGLAAVLPSDSDNLYVVLSARLLQPKLWILARGADEKSNEKMKRAGANRVVDIYEAGAHKMARMLGNVNLEDFIEILSTREDRLDIAQITVSATADYCGRTLANSGFRERDIMIVGVGKPGGQFLIPPPSTVSIHEGDRLIALGKAADLTAFLHPTD